MKDGGWTENGTASPYGEAVACERGLSGEYFSNSLSSFLLCRGGDVGIGVQGEPSGEVTQHAGHGLDVHTILECDGSEGVAEVMEPDLWNASPFKDTLEHIVDAVRRDRTAVG